MRNILISANTHPGMHRSANQDAAIIRQLRPDDKVLAAVIDGVGGYAGGERAASIAKDCIEQYMQTPSGDTLTMLREAVIFANNQIAEERKKDPHFSEMCCVLTALVADSLAQRIYFAHVGDTRLYRYRDGKLQKLTRDHSFVGIREDAGEISENEAMTHPHRNQILREVGSALHRLDDEDFMDYGSDALVPGDILLLCSDGLTDMITSQQVASVLAINQNLKIKTDKLIELANKSGGHDNITVVLLEYPLPLKPTKSTTVTTVAVAKYPAIVSAQNNTTKNRHWGKSTLISSLLLLIGIAGASWYFTAPKTTGMQAVSYAIPVQPVDTLQSDSGHIKSSGRASHQAIQGPELPEKADTLRISSTQNFADLKRYMDSTGKMLVLVPKNHHSNNFSAVSITVRSVKSGDTLLIRNIRLTGFENGIDIHLPIVLEADNLAFENVHNPFRCLFKPGEQKASVLFINTMKQ